MGGAKESGRTQRARGSDGAHQTIRHGRNVSTVTQSGRDTLSTRRHCPCLFRNQHVRTARSTGDAVSGVPDARAQDDCTEHGKQVVIDEDLVAFVAATAQQDIK